MLKKENSFIANYYDLQKLAKKVIPLTKSYSLSNITLMVLGIGSKQFNRIKIY